MVINPFLGMQNNVSSVCPVSFSFCLTPISPPPPPHPTSKIPISSTPFPMQCSANTTFALLPINLDQSKTNSCPKSVISNNDNRHHLLQITTLVIFPSAENWNRLSSSLTQKTLTEAAIFNFPPIHFIHEKIFSL